MDANWLVWLLDNVPTRLLDALELVSIAYLIFWSRLENKKMLNMIQSSEQDFSAMLLRAKAAADIAYAPSTVKNDVHDLKGEIASIHKKVDDGFSSLSTQITNLSNAVISAMSHK